jgi:hypothetical protein
MVWRAVRDSVKSALAETPPGDPEVAVGIPVGDVPTSNMGIRFNKYGLPLKYDINSIVS